ncbi:MAG: 50S ribosomal protein L11 methyltransferase [Actinomycetota bacterium]|nr:50S ribosomal protein L11 methyltransferase [Actinomycetota bacterium]
MLELFPGGFEEVDLEDERVELAAYADGDGEARLRQALGPCRTEEVEPGWSEAWKRFHHPVRIGRLWIGAPWHDADPGALAVVIEPGLAFGTGSHPTTRLSLELLLACAPSTLVDLGCGSGVVAIAAASLGARPVFALDVDPVAVAVARANAAANGVAVDVRAGDVLEEALPYAELAVANIALDVVEELLPRLASRLVVTSGYLARERPHARGWEPLERRVRDGWAADLLARR